VASEVLLEGDESRVLIREGGDVGLVTLIVEPPVHHGVLLAHLLLELVSRRLEVTDLASNHPRERIGHLGHGHFVPREVYLASDPPVRVLEGCGRENADVGSITPHCDRFLFFLLHSDRYAIDTTSKYGGIAVDCRYQGHDGER
jgi:hypothetical protein